MASEQLNIYTNPTLHNPRLLLGFSGWMDGGEVSTGTVQCLIDKLDAERFAEIEPNGFYIYSLPGTMEVTALFRPHTKIQDGIVETYDIPTNTFYVSEKSNMILFLGKEPSLRWDDFGDCIFTICEDFGVKTIYFIGSVAGLVPHTREPRLFCSVSDSMLKETFKHYGVNFSNYEGPASIVTYLTSACRQRDLGMVSLVATIPAYVQGNNPKCIEAVTRRLAGMLDIDVDLSDMASISEDFEKKLVEVIQEQPELADNIRKLEEDYDNEIFNSEMGDLKSWLEQQGIQVD